MNQRPGENMTAKVLTAAVLAALLSTTALSQDVDPRAPGALTLPEFGRMNGTLRQVTAVDERFGRQIYGVGEVSGDGIDDWILTHRRCDTGAGGSGGYAVIELLLYHGVRSGLPPTSAGMRIGPSEVDADCSFIGAGDYDADGHRDLAISIHILSDRLTRGFWISSIVVFWNDGTGNFSLSDTTHLTAPTQRTYVMAQADYELVATTPTRCDIDQDLVDDLVVVTEGVTFIDTVRYPAPHVMIFRGQHGRWGRGGISRRPDWQLWQRLFTRRVSVLDHDGDGALDFALFRDEVDIGYHGGVSIIYGRRGMLPDTTSESVEFSRFDGIDGKQCELIDVTGDHVPELILTTADTVDGDAFDWNVYVGRRGQRLSQQYGGGNDAPRPGDSLWWGRPWSLIRTPFAINDSWSAPKYPVFDPGDLGLDGVGDFCAGSYPGIVCYNGGKNLDSWIDAGMQAWPVYELHFGRFAKLGDIDGSGRPAIAYGRSGGGVVFIKSDPRVPRGGDPIRLPEGTDKVLSVPLKQLGESPPLTVQMAPNPASKTTQLEWSSTGRRASVVLHDAIGHDLRRWTLPAGTMTLTIDVAGMPSGVYVISLTSGHRSVSLQLIHTQ